VRGKDNPDDPDRPAPRRPDLQPLREALRTGDGEGLLEFFRQQALSDRERAEVLALVDQLGKEPFAQRQKATTELREWGSRASALLRRATRHPDPEIAGRAERCLRDSLKGFDAAPLAAALRLLGQRPPPGAAAALLDYLPYAEEENLADAAQAALVRAAVRDGSLDEAVPRALADPLPERRAAAGLALCQSQTGFYESHRPALRKLLHDPDPEVRRRLALALVPLKEKEALPALVALLAELPPRQAWPVLEMLEAVAGPQAPAVVPGHDAAGRRRCHDAWQAWWREHGTRLDLSRMDIPLPGKERLLGHTLIVQIQMGLSSLTGQVIELAADQTLRWQIDGLDYPLSAQVLPGDLVLVAEYHGRRVTERNFRGGIQWSKEFDTPLVYAQRLPGGNTFLVCRNRVFELDGAGRETFSHRRPTRDLVTARKCDSGQVVLLTDAGDCVFLDAAGRQTRRFATGAQQVLGAGMDVLANRRVLLPHFAGNKVVEYSPAGEVLWQAEAASPTGVQRLPGGHTLVTSTTRKEVVELDRDGKVVWKVATAPLSPVLATRR
jgi:HEAT repeat protein